MNYPRATLFLSFLFWNTSLFAKVDALVFQQISKIGYQQHEIINNNKIYSKRKEFRLDRFDIETGITLSGDVGVLSFAGGSAVEYIWRRRSFIDDTNLTKTNDEEETITLNSENSDSKNLYKLMSREVSSFLSFQKVRKRFKNRIKRKLRKDAEKISALIKDLVHMPVVGNWAIDRFFKSYSFSQNLSLGIVKFGGSKRIRFRFKLAGLPYRMAPEQSLNKKQQNLFHVMTDLNKMSRNQYLNQFRLYRARVIHNLSMGLNIGLTETNFSKGVTIEYKKLQTPNSFDEFSAHYHSGHSLFAPADSINHFLISQFDRINFKDEREFNLDEVRIKYATDISAGIKIVTIDKASEIEFHYRRQI